MTQPTMPRMPTASPERTRALAEAVEDLAGDLGGAEIREVLCAGEKSVLACGYQDGRPVVIKALRTGEEFWRAKFAHEIGLYRAFTDTPPPVRLPELLYTDGHRILVLEQVCGRAVDAERYPELPLPAPTLDAVLDTVTAFARWRPPPGMLAPTWDYADRVERYHRSEFFDSRDRAALHALLAEAGPVGQVNHGDPLPANLLMAEEGGCVLLDFEFTGLFLPGFDLAMLHSLLAVTPDAQARIDALVADTGIEAAFLANQAMVLSRELRLHTELPDDAFRRKRLAVLEPQWDAFRRRLHTRG